MKKIGIFKVGDVLNKPDSKLTEFEQVLLKGIHWFANVQTQYEDENKLLSLITCLETFLTPRDGNPIGTAIAEGVAILIATGLDNRKKLKRRIKEFYQMRSAVSHGGRKAILEAELAELMVITKYLTTIMIERKDEFGTHKSLFDWIEAKKLG